MDRHEVPAGRLRQQVRTASCEAHRTRARGRLGLLAAAFAPVLAALALSAAAANASVAMCDVPITMSDGVVLRANI